LPLENNKANRNGENIFITTLKTQEDYFINAGLRYYIMVKNLGFDI
jgi:hypothetical protein